MSNSTSAIPPRTWLDPRVELRVSPVGGLGLFATALIAEGEPVIVWGGPSYTNAAGAREAARAGKGFMQWDSDVYSIETGDEDIAYRINHSCDPNMWMEGAFTLTARRPIQLGEELLADYALWETSEDYVSPWDCHCGSPRCRTRVTGRDWHLPEIQQRYRGHFSPLLNARIQRMQEHE